MADGNMERYVEAAIACIGYNLVNTEGGNKLKFKDGTEWFYFDGTITSEIVKISLTKPSSFSMEVEGTPGNYKYYGSCSGALQFTVNESSFRGRDTNTNNSFNCDIESSRVVLNNETSREEVVFESFSK